MARLVLQDQTPRSNAELQQSSGFCGLARALIRVRGLGFTCTVRNLPFLGFVIMISLYESLKR